MMCDVDEPIFAKPWDPETARRHTDHRFIAPLVLRPSKEELAIRRAREQAKLQRIRRDLAQRSSK